MNKTIKRAAREFLVSVAIEAGTRVGKSAGRRIGQWIEQCKQPPKRKVKR